MALDPALYVGREQAFVKHLFLQDYLGALLHKLASAYDQIAYVDGFSGPWKSGDERYTDTSFGIALRLLTEAKGFWSAKGRTVGIEAHLVEKLPSSFAELVGINSLFPSAEIHPYNKDFMEVAQQISDSISPEAFTFNLVDPKGFFDLARLSPLLSRPRNEVVFNFMFDFANRFRRHERVEPKLDCMFHGVDWRSRLDLDDPNSTPASRKAAFLACFKDAVRGIGGYNYIADVDVQYPGKDRTFYFLVYATHSPAGIEVFRNSQMRALSAQSEIQGRIRVENEEAKGQLGFFQSQNEMSEASHLKFVRQEKSRASHMLMDLVRQSEGQRWKDLWPKILADCAVKRSELNLAAKELKERGHLTFPQWERSKRVPDDSYRVYLGNEDQAR